MTSERTPYPTVSPQPDVPALERAVLEFWREDDTFRASVEQHPQGGEHEFVFYDGPPFANGLPHYGHLLTGYVKDTVPRYMTMRGKRVERRFGWDCHGLPAEMEAERELGLGGRQEILELGIDRFNEYCRTSVLRYTNEWQDYVERQARWVDFENDYKTLDLSYMESVLWAFKTLHDRGLIYEGHRVLPYCWECETPLSNFETRLDDAYRDREDPTVTVAFRLEPVEGEDEPLEALVWTTTPWTLPSNLALAVGPGLRYQVLRHDGRRFVLGANVPRPAGLEDAEVVAELDGRALVGRRYRPLFDYFADHEQAFRVLAADFVSDEEGTGIVHLAPAFGEDDQLVCEAAGITLVNPVDGRGRFTEEVPDFAGLQVFEANPAIVEALRERGVLVDHATIVHPYPHCWRTDTPLVYRAVSSWFLAVTEIKERLLEANQRIRWVPEHIRDGAFGRWLENARDWSISRNRFWGCPIPVWVSDDPRYPRVDVYGSIAELERDFGVPVTELHRPAIDELTRPNPDDPTGQSTMRRVGDVLDCWFESGSMPFAQVHYPFENQEWFDGHFPANFIVEYIGQTRGWFYTLHVLAVALFDQPAFDSCIVHGVLLGSDGRKMSKRLRNYPAPETMFDKHGADAMRWFLQSSPVLRGADLIVDEDGIVSAVRQAILPLWSVWHFFSLYANADGVRARWDTSSPQLLDRYVLAKTRRLVEDVGEALDGLDLQRACGLVLGHLDMLTNWYVRRSRERFWRAEVDEDKRHAFDTLYVALEVLCRVAAPLLPLVTEGIYRDLTGERSVHLRPWPDAEELPDDPALVADMDLVRATCSAALSVRETSNLRVRLPLPSLSVAGAPAERLRAYERLIADEVNVKEVRWLPELEGVGRQVLRVNPRVLGPRLGAATQDVIRAAREGRWEVDGDRVVAAGQRLEPGEYELAFELADEEAARQVTGDVAVVLDRDVTPELEREGLARDVVRLVQQARRDAGLDVSDWISLRLDAPEDVLEAVRAHERHVAEQVRATAIQQGADGQAASGRLSDGRTVGIAITRAG